MSDHGSSLPADTQPGTGSTQPEVEPLLTQPGATPLDTPAQQRREVIPSDYLISNQPDLPLPSDTLLPQETDPTLPSDVPPPLPERRPVPAGNPLAAVPPAYQELTIKTPPAQHPASRDNLPPPPPEPPIPAPAVTMSQAQPDDQPPHQEKGGTDHSDLPHSVIVHPMEAMRPKSGHEDIQMQVDALNLSAIVASMQNHPDQPNGAQEEGHEMGKLSASTEGYTNYMAKDPGVYEEEEDQGDGFADFDVDDIDNEDDAWQNASIVSKGILLLQKTIRKVYQLVNKLAKGKLMLAIFLVSYTVYFIMAMVHKFGDEGSHRLLACTVFGAFILVYPYLKKLFLVVVKKVYGSDTLKPNHATIWAKARTVIRWILYVAMTGIMLYFLIDEGRDKKKNMRAVPGIFIFLLIAFLLSTRPSKVNWHTIFWSVALQFLCAVFVLKWKWGNKCVLWVQDRFNEFFANSEAGSRLFFGATWADHQFVFGGLPLVFFSNAVFTVMYYLGAMQFIISIIGNILKFVTGVSPLEAMSISTGIFMEGFTNLIVMRPFLHSMTKSQMFAVVTGCMSSLGGAYLAILASLGISLEYVIPAMLVSAPATFAVCKLMVPEISEEVLNSNDKVDDLCAEERTRYSNIMDAIQTGAMAMLSVVGNILVVGFSFVSLISWLNHTFSWFGDRVGIDDLSIEYILSYALYPVALAMGVHPDDCRRVAMLLGYRIGIYNVVAFLRLTEMKVNKFKWLGYMQATNFTGPVDRSALDIKLVAWNETLNNGFLTDRSEAIATYCLCGFSSVVSAMMILGLIFTLVPQRKKWLATITAPAIIAGNLANCMTGCFASLFY